MISPGVTRHLLEVATTALSVEGSNASRGGSGGGSSGRGGGGTNGHEAGGGGTDGGSGGGNNRGSSGGHLGCGGGNRGRGRSRACNGSLSRDTDAADLTTLSTRPDGGAGGLVRRRRGAVVEVELDAGRGVGVVTGESNTLRECIGAGGGDLDLDATWVELGTTSGILSEEGICFVESDNLSCIYSCQSVVYFEDRQTYREGCSLQQGRWG